jgi:hypothetical protein
MSKQDIRNILTMISANNYLQGMKHSQFHWNMGYLLDSIPAEDLGLELY